jgi:hypothetical protein
MTTRILFSFLCCAALAGILAGCKKEAPPSLFAPDYVSGPQPTVARIDPPSDALAGVTILTIVGTNFSATPANDIVFFDAVTVPVIQASTTQLQVKAPFLVSDTIKVKIAVLGSDLFNTPFVYKLNAAADDKFGNFSAADEPVAVECDTAGNVYVSIVSSGAGIGVKKFTPVGVRSDYSPVFSGAVASWRGMKFGPGGALFTVTGRNIIFRVPPGGGTSAIWLSGGGLTPLYDLDFDQSGNIWTGGPGATSVFRVKQDKTLQAFPFTGTVRSVRVYNGYLYVGGKRDSLEKVWRFPIDGTGNLGVEEEYFNLSTRYGANSFGVTALTFASDGDLYVGTDGSDGIIVVHPDRSYAPFYPGILKGQTASLSWGKGFDLFQSRTGTPGPKTIVKINVQKAGAPYYGRTLP